ncbi:MAG: hypothetical protein K8I03_02225 [Ignavibacteria bacterium]|nr:hypothetical protein [Ignavibacteria bacterium]
MQKTLLHNFRFKKNRQINVDRIRAEKGSTLYSENFLREELISSYRARILAIAIFLFYFIENGTLGLIPERFYMVYRNVRLSDLILYSTVLYSLIRYNEYRELVNSKPFLIVKLFLLYLLIEFLVSYIRYGFPPEEYFFRLKGIWQSFLIFPFLLLLKRNGLPFLIKLVFPVAVISNLLYILSALTGIPFLPDVWIVTQWLPGDIVVYRVFGGTFYGEMFFIGIIYYWINKRFRAWQLGLVVLFIVPHILAFGRLAWASLSFTIFMMIVLNSLSRRNFSMLFRQAIILIITSAVLIFAFIKFIPKSDYYLDALNARIFQGQDDVMYGEGTYGARVITQNDALVNLWANNDIFLGVGMHPMWVLGPESREEAIYYSAFSDVGWPGVLAAYGIVGFALALFFQIYFIFLAYKLIKKNPRVNIYTFFVTILLSKLIFDSTVGLSYIFISTTLWGFYGPLCQYIPVMIYLYEKNRSEGIILQNIS